MAHVLFVCLHNAGRSQMSRALFERAAAERHEAESAGTTPAAHVHPEGIAAREKTPRETLIHDGKPWPCLRRPVARLERRRRRFRRRWIVLLRK